MQELLGQLNAVSGVVGSLLCDTQGNLLARAFPPLFDDALLRSAAGLVSNGASSLENVTGKVSSIDLRYGNARILVRGMTGAHLLLLCTAQTDFQRLAISASLALPKLERLLVQAPVRGSAAPPAPSLAAPTQGGQLHDAVQRIERIIARKGLPAFKTKGEIALRAGFALVTIEPRTPDDAEKLASLKAAAAEVLHESI